MVAQILCEQFVYSKFTGASRSASYKFVAKSLELTENIAIEIRRAFNGCRPTSTALSSYTTSYVVTPVGDKKLALLRLDVIKDLESKNSYILHEHYLVVDRELLLANHLKPWQLLTAIPKPEVMFEYKSLPGFIGIPDQSFEEKIFDTFKYLSNSMGVFSVSIFTSLYYLLNTQRASIFFDNGSYDLWDWLKIIDMLVPISIELKLQLFLGAEPPKGWHPNISLIRSNPKIKDVSGIDVSSDYGRLLTLEQLKTGYTNFMWRSLLCNDASLFSKLLFWSENINTDMYEKQNQSHDLFLRNEIPSEIRLDLARLEFQHNRIVVEDLYWLWQNGKFNLGDIQKFLPILLAQTLDRWTPSDFFILSKYVAEFSSKDVATIILKSEISNASRNLLLIGWGQSVKKLSETDITLWLYLLIYLASKEPEMVFSALIQFLKLVDLSEFKGVKKILASFPKNTVASSSYFWLLVFWSFCHVKQENDIATCIDILLSANIFEKSQLILSFLVYLSRRGKNKDNASAIMSQIILDADRSQVLPAFLPHAINLVLLSNYPDALTSLAISLKDARIPSVSMYKLKNEIFKPDNGVLFEYREKILLSKDEKYISAYIFLLIKILYKEKAREVLTDVLVQDVDLFARVVEFTQTRFRLNTEDFTISLSMLQKLTKEDQLRLLIIYFISVASVDKSLHKLPIISKLLMTVKSIDFVESNILEKLLSLLLENEEWATARKILEHQVRSTILLKNDKDVHSKLGILFKVVSREHKLGALEQAKGKMVISYVKALPIPAQQELWIWLLIHPLSDIPLLKHARFQPFTTNLIIDHVDWFTENPFIRYCLFEELSKWR